MLQTVIKNTIFVQKLKILTLKRIFANVVKTCQKFIKLVIFGFFRARELDKNWIFYPLHTKWFSWEVLIAEFSFLGLPTNQWFSL